MIDGNDNKTLYYKFSIPRAILQNKNRISLALAYPVWLFCLNYYLIKHLWKHSISGLFVIMFLPGPVDGGGLCRLNWWLRGAVNNFKGNGGA